MTPIPFTQIVNNTNFGEINTLAFTICIFVERIKFVNFYGWMYF